MNSTSNISSRGFDIEWSFRISDAGEPPSLVVIALWLLISLCVSLLFLVVRPAATRKVREDASDSRNANGEGGRHRATETFGVPLHPQQPQPQQRHIDDDTESGTYVAVAWRLLAAVWTLALYDVVHRTCCYVHLSAYMLARHKLLPLGSRFLWDGVWTEWVNWVRLYGLCGASFSLSAAASSGFRATAEGKPLEAAAATSGDACVGWQLPLAGVLPYSQYPEFAALNASRLPSDAEVSLYHRMSVEAFVVTVVTVVQLHSAFSLLYRIFRQSLLTCHVERHPNETIEAGVTASSSGASFEGPATGEVAHANTKGSYYTTSLCQTDAPGDDAWVDSPEALAEEEARRLQEGDADAAPTQDSRDDRRISSTSQTTHLMLQCWPCFASAGYAAMYAYVGGLPLLMSMVFPCGVVIVCLLAIFAPS